MRQVVFSLFFLVFISSFHLYGGDGGVSKAKLFAAKQEFLGGRYQNALDIYKELLETSPDDGALNFAAGECQFLLGRNMQALEYLEKSQSVGYSEKPELFFYLGRIYHIKGEIDKALSAYDAFRGKVGSLQKVSESKVDYYIAQCKDAKNLMANPVDVKIKNIGAAINSTFDDKAAILSPDEKVLYFNTRRPMGKLSPKDGFSDGKYFDNVYRSLWDEEKNAWMPAEPIPGRVNYYESHDACTGISPDGTQLLVYKNEDFLTSSGDIFVSKLDATNKWQTSASIHENINTPFYEDGACFSPDGNTIYFVSERKGGYGKSDIYMSNRISSTEWEKPVNLGSVVNSPEDEVGLFMASDGKTLFFCSSGHNSMGSYDVFKTVLDKGTWSKPVNLGYPINTTWRDGPISFNAEGTLAYLTTNRPGGTGDCDIYEVDMTNYKQFTKPEPKKKKGQEEDQPGLSVLKGMVIDFEAGQAMDVEIGIYDEYGQKITKVKSNIDGEYAVTLPGDKKYELRVKVKNYSDYAEKLFLPVGKEGEEKFVLEKTIEINRVSTVIKKKRRGR